MQKKGKFVDLSDDDLYEQCKAEDGIPEVGGTYPNIGAKIACRSGIASIEVYKTGDVEKIKADRAKYKLGGYAFVTEDYLSVIQAIYQNGAVSASFGIDYNWFRGTITKVLKTLGRHYVVLNGFDTSRGTVSGQNSWGISWIGRVAGLFNNDIKAGCFEMRWVDYYGSVLDIIVFTDIPEELLEEVKKYDYRFVTTMRYGSRGYEVIKLQERLGITADGVFGRGTESAVKSFQTINNLVVDGIVGPGTRKVLNVNTKSLIEIWAGAIKNHEGYFEGSRSFRNCNPANFKTSGSVTPYMAKLGATGVDSGGFCIFPSYEVGFKALCTFLEDACNDKLSSYRKTMTIYEFFSKYAPASDNNDTLAYAKTVAKSLGVSINTRIEELL